MNTVYYVLAKVQEAVRTCMNAKAHMNILKNKNTVVSIISVKASESRIRLAIFTFLTLVSFKLC